MWRKRSSWRSRCWSWAPFLAAVLSLTSLCAPRSSAQEPPQPTESERSQQKPTLQSIEQNLLSILSSCDSLKNLLQQRSVDSQTAQQLIDSLRAQLTDSLSLYQEWREASTSSQKSLEESAAEMTRLSGLLTKSQVSFETVSKEFESFKKNRAEDLAAAQQERDRALSGALLYKVLFGVSTGLLVLDLLARLVQWLFSLI